MNELEIIEIPEGYSPTSREILDILSKFPDGLTSQELVEISGRPYPTIAVGLRDLKLKGLVYSEKKLDAARGPEGGRMPLVWQIRGVEDAGEILDAFRAKETEQAIRKIELAETRGIPKSKHEAGYRLELQRHLEEIIAVLENYPQGLSPIELHFGLADARGNLLWGYGRSVDWALGWLFAGNVITTLKGGKVALTSKESWTPLDTLVSELRGQELTKQIEE